MNIFHKAKITALAFIALCLSSCLVSQTDRSTLSDETAASSAIKLGTVEGVCVKVADGDTATVLVNGNQQVKVRFHGIDAPESSQDFGQRAKQRLSDLIYGKRVRVEILERDRYGRCVCKVYVGSTYINHEMVKSGLAWHYVRYAPRDTDLAEAEKAARLAERGLWSHPNPTPPWNWRRGTRTNNNASHAGNASR